MMASGQQLGEEYVQRFATWVASKSEADFRGMVGRGVLSRKEICRECEFSGSVLSQNPRVRDALKRLEDDLRARGVLPPAVAFDDSESAPKPSQRTENSPRAAREAERLSRLEQENASLKAQIGELKRMLGRYAVLQEVLSETGRLPR